MKKLIAAAAALFCAAAIMVHAQDATPAKPAKKELTAEQQALMKEMLAKYDTNKDGKLDKTERAAMSKEDKDKMIKAGLMKSGKKSADKTNSTDKAPAADTNGK